MVNLNKVKSYGSYFISSFFPLLTFLILILSYGFWFSLMLTIVVIFIYTLVAMMLQKQEVLYLPLENRTITSSRLASREQ